jgi:hypothetical protein
MQGRICIEAAFRVMVVCAFRMPELILCLGRYTRAELARR